MVVWCHANGHHAVECEVEQCEVPKEEVPEELGNRPLEADHRVHYDTVYEILTKCVWELDDNLPGHELMSGLLSIIWGNQQQKTTHMEFISRRTIHLSECIWES